MKKLAFSFFASFFVIIFIWFIMGYIQHGEKIFDMHLDFKSSLSSLTNIFEFHVSDYLDALESWTELTRFEGSFLDGIGLFFDSLIVEPINLLFDTLDLFVGSIVGIFKFIFYPKFI